jgi:hypothetical protein
MTKLLTLPLFLLHLSDVHSSDRRIGITERKRQAIFGGDGSAPAERHRQQQSAQQGERSTDPVF